MHTTQHYYVTGHNNSYSYSYDVDRDGEWDKTGWTRSDDSGDSLRVSEYCAVSLLLGSGEQRLQHAKATQGYLS